MIPKALFTFINLVCITLCVYVVVDGLYASVVDRLRHHPMATQTDAYRIGNATTSRRPVSAYKAVLERNLFDTRSSSSQPLPQKVDVESLEETKLDLKLWGTVSGSEQGAYAVIEDVKAREQNLYRAGDAIQNATIKEIYREKVVLTVDGTDEVLQMQELESGKGFYRPVGQPASRGGTSPAVRAQRISLRRAYIDQSMTDMATLMTQVQIQPHMENGVPEGLALSKIKPNSIFRRMGLRNGDIITGVDGNEIASVDDALRLVDGLRSASSLSVQLKRRGREKTIEYTIR